MNSKQQRWQTYHFRVGKTQMIVSAKTRSVLEAVHTLRYHCATRPLVYMPDYKAKPASRPTRLSNRKGVMR
jgi:hypothetical protein